MPQLTALSWYHLGIFGVLVPYLSIRSHARLNTAKAPLNRLTHFRTTTVMLVAFAALSLLTAWKQHLWLFTIDRAGLWKGLPAAVAMYVVAVLLMKPRWRKAVVWLSGGLLLAMAVHIAYDITAGLNYGKLGKALGYSELEQHAQ